MDLHQAVDNLKFSVNVAVEIEATLEGSAVGKPVDAALITVEDMDKAELERFLTMLSQMVDAFNEDGE